MKKITNGILVLTILLSTHRVHAQSNTEKELSAGIMIDYIAIHDFGSETKQPFTPVLLVAPSLNLTTQRFHYHLMYGFDNSIQTLNGYFLKRNWDIYSMITKSLSKKDIYTAFGIEKISQLNPRFEVIYYSEIGYNFYGTLSISFGFVLHPTLLLKHFEEKDDEVIPQSQY